MNPRFVRDRAAAALAMAAVVLTGFGPLAGCIPVAATAIGASAFGAVDRRTFGAQVEDQSLQVRGNQRLREILPGDETAYATVNAYNRRVLLVGQAPDEATKERASQLIGTLGNVKLINNEIRVGGPVISAARDTALTARVKAALINVKDVDATAIKVVSEASVVYLMGIVTQRESDAAAEAARQVPNVARVVTVFDIISEDELKDMRPPPDSSPPPPGSTPKS